MSMYWKSITAAAAAAGSIVVAVTNDINNALADNSVTTAEWWFIGIAVVNAVGVYAKANTAPVRR